MQASDHLDDVEPQIEASGIGRLYVLAWFPYLAVYTFVLASMSGLPLVDASLGALANVLPAALLGILVLHSPVSSRVRRPLLGHLSRGLVFTLAAVCGTWLLFLPMWRWRFGRWLPEHLDWRPLPWQLFIAALIYVVLATLAESLHLRRRLERERARAARARALQSRAELESLRAQLDPHFLFNTLQTLLELFRSEPNRAEEALERFADLLHYQQTTRRKRSGLVALSEEWRFTASYLHLEQLRLGDRLEFHLHGSPEALRQMVPTFTLQPLVENAVRHGLGPRARGGRVAIRAEVSGSVLSLEVDDDGVGAEPDSLVRTRGLGLRLVRDRLEALYGARARLTLDTRPEGGCTVTLDLPLDSEATGSAPGDR